MTDFIKVYAEMNDGELVSLAAEADSLTEEARSALWGELRRRGLEAEARDVYEEHRQEAEPSDEPLPRLVTIGEFDDPLNAHLAKVRLEEEGVDCFLKDEEMNRLYSRLASAALGGIKLQVSEADADRATEILGVEKEAARTGAPRAPLASPATLVTLLLLWALAAGVIVLLVYLFEPFQ